LTALDPCRRAAPVVAWLLSGERFLGAALEMVDLSAFDDIILTGVVGLEKGKASLGLPDVFTALRGAFQSAPGLERYGI